MKNILKYTAAALLSSALLCGCIKETFPNSVATSEQMASSPTALKALVNGMSAFVNNYATISDDYAFDWGYPSIGMIRDFMCEDLSSAPSSYEWFSAWMENSYQSEDYVYGQYIWNFYTKFLFTANSVISAAGDVSSASAAIKANVGMAYCYRALINLDMGRMYEFKKNIYTAKPEVEGLTIPIISENITEAEARNNPRVTKRTLLDQVVYPDLQKAVEYLDGYKRVKMNEPDKSVAFGLLARAYMWDEDYTNAKAAADSALANGNYKPLTEAQWTDTKNGFNNSSSQSSWMWASMLSEEDPCVKSGILNWASWMCSETYFGYACAGPFRLCDVNFYGKISDGDFRKKSWTAPAGSSLDVPMVAATSTYDPTIVPELAQVKFRPGGGNPDDYKVGATVDYPMMRMEEMNFIIAECEAQSSGSTTYLDNFIKTYRNPSYSHVYANAVDEVILQKRIEFWGEGIIFFDYKRLNKGVNRGYKGTNHIEKTRFNTEGLAPWMNFCIVKTESNANKALVNNPDPSDKVTEWTE